MNTKLTKLDYFELMDRCHIQLSNIGDHLPGHPALSAEMQYKLDVACEMIYDVYNYASNELNKLDGIEPAIHQINIK